MYNIFRNLTRLSVTLIFTTLVMAGCNNKPKTSPPPMVPEVSVINVKTEPVTLTTELPGRVSAYLIAEVRPQVSGIIKKRFFTEGSDVREGDILYQIDPSTYETAYLNAKASLSRAEANLPAIRQRVERYKELLPSKAVSQQDFDDAQSALKQAEADVEYWKAAVKTAEINLSYTKVKAPISGRIGRSFVTDGALVTANQPTPLTTIQRIDPVYVDVTQSTNELMALRKRLEEGRISGNTTLTKKLSLIFEDGTIYPYTGTLEFRDISVDPSTGSVTVRLVFPNSKHILLPNMFVRARIAEGVNPKAILIPQQSVIYTQKGEPTVFVVNKDNKVEQRLITIERAMGNKWLVSSGLKTGEKVIVEGIQKARPDMPVKVVELSGGK